MWALTFAVGGRRGAALTPVRCRCTRWKVIYKSHNFCLGMQWIFMNVKCATPSDNFLIVEVNIIFLISDYHINLWFICDFIRLFRLLKNYWPYRANICAITNANLFLQKAAIQPTNEIRLKYLLPLKTTNYNFRLWGILLILAVIVYFKNIISIYGCST